MKKIRLQIIRPGGGQIVPFLLFILVALYYCFDRGIFPSVDAPSHFHNAVLLREYISGNPVVRESFVLTPVYIPNLFSNYFIALLGAFLSYKATALVFFFLYYLLSCASTYYLLGGYNVKHRGLLSLFILLFFNSNLFNMGFYNFSWSVIFLFYSLGFYQKHIYDSRVISLRSGLGLFCLVLLIYYATALTFLFFLMLIALFEMQKLISYRKADAVRWDDFFKRAGILFLTVSPFLFMLLLFYLRVDPVRDLEPNNYSSLTNLLRTLSAFIVYAPENEVVYTRIIFYLLASLLVFTILWRVIVTKMYLHKTDVYFLLALVMLFLYYKVPDLASVGMMNSRFQYFFYLFLILWLVLQETRVFKIVGVLGIAFISVLKYQQSYVESSRQFDSCAETIIKASGDIVANSSVHVYDFTGNYMLSHYSNYLGIAKPLIITVNYEAQHSWFPLKWDFDKMPWYKIAGETYPHISLMTYNKNQPGLPQYIYIYGDLNQVANWNGLQEELDSHYARIREMPGFSRLYIKKKVTI